MITYYECGECNSYIKPMNPLNAGGHPMFGLETIQPICVKKVSGHDRYYHKYCLENKNDLIRP